MIKRVRDKLRTFRPQEVIHYSDWDDIQTRAAMAEAVIGEGKPVGLMLTTELKNAEDIVLTNRVHEVREVRVLGELKRIFTTDKQEQLNELVGQIKFIRGFLAELQSWIDRKTTLEHLEANGKIIIRRSAEEENLHERS